jgi:hypothetical protein
MTHACGLLTPLVLALREVAELGGAAVGVAKERAHALRFAVTLLRIRGLGVGSALRFYGLALAWVVYSAAAVVFCLVLYPAFGIAAGALSSLNIRGLR